MYPRLFRTLPLLASVALFAAACSDAPTAPAAAPEAVLSSQAAKPLAASPGSSPYACFTSVRTPGGATPWTYGRLELHFPKTALAPDGATLRYQYRRYSPEGTLLRLANCVIPRTEEAATLVQRRLRAPGGVAMGSGKRSGQGEVGTLDTEYCHMENGVCTFNEIVVQSQVQPSNCETPGCSTGSTGSSWGDGGGDTGGGGGPCYSCEPDQPLEIENDAVDKDAPPPDCAQQQTDDRYKAYCSGTVPSGERKTRTDLALARIEKRGDVCAAIVRRARELITAQTFRYYTDQGYRFGGASQGWQGWAAFDERWADRATTAAGETELDRMIVHEIDHERLNLVPERTDIDGHLRNPDGSVDIKETANSKQCSGR